ncbi:anti-sigma factor antagonist [Streptomyces sp. WAC07149]|uniref:STAS domain-containing protein n=1 Tax=Streptomyces sp. WAC07149 TaxID=2487425 RepID=UPI000F771E10|nr:STAS domain-containing protein [Streptomyces sp. WAC07149]RST06662.1 anti-sigma factor antagonist [Streptomyces sp. WAC07149]
MTSQPQHVAVVFEAGPQRGLARVSGEIDMDEAPDLREELSAALEASSTGLDVDLAAVTFCDSSGLHVLLDLNQLAVQAGKTLVLTAVSRPVARVLHLSGVERVLAVRPPVLWVKHRRYGPTVHLAPVGRLDESTGAALEEATAGLEGVDVVACDMQDLTLMDVTGLDALIGFARRLDARGIAFFAYNWQPQPQGLLDLVDQQYPRAERPTRLLRRLQDFAAAARTAGAARAANGSRTGPGPGRTSPGRLMPHI